MPTLALVGETMVKQTGFPKGEPDSLYRRDSPWISSYNIQKLNSIEYHRHISRLQHYMDLFVT